MTPAPVIPGIRFLKKDKYAIFHIDDFSDHLKNQGLVENFVGLTLNKRFFLLSPNSMEEFYSLWRTIEGVVKFNWVLTKRDIVMQYRMRIVSEDPVIIIRHDNEIVIEIGNVYSYSPKKPTRKRQRQNLGRIVEVLGFTDNFAPEGVIVKYSITTDEAEQTPWI